ncbi:MAG: acyl carrier protein [Frankiales bacterium]|nr:acyl carrier protein [Frankiales bacterium]MCW2587271.1 acyl carrier protein [Frankiales bacterium]
MTGEQVLDVIRAAVVTVLEVQPGTVGRATRFVEDLRADSLAIVEIVEIVEEELARRVGPGFRIDDEDLEDLVTVGDALDYALARL